MLDQKINYLWLDYFKNNNNLRSITQIGHIAAWSETKQSFDKQNLSSAIVINPSVVYSNSSI